MANRLILPWVRFLFLVVLSLACSGLICTLTVHAQVVRGSMTGRVSDSSGAAVPHASIQIKNQLTGVTYRTQTTAAGIYVMPELQPGIYTIIAYKAGFQRFRVTGVRLYAAQSVRQDLTLKIGAMSQTVQVLARPHLIDTVTPSITTALNRKQIQLLPQAMQDIDGFLLLAAGVGRSSFNSAPQIAGSTHWGADNFNLNGVSVNDAGNGGGSYSFGLGGVNLPALSSLQEVRIGGINMDARSSRVVNIMMVTKAGTNKFHGDAYEYVENNALNANTFLLNRLGKPRSPFRRNQFGFDLGGPILHNHAFFFFDYSGARQSIPFTHQANLPTMAERTGNFMALCSSYNSSGICTAKGGTQLYNPYTGAAFPNNQIPASMITSQAKTLLGFMPPPIDRSSSGLPQEAPNYTTVVSQVFHVNKYDLRLDDHLSSNDSLFGVFSGSVGSPWFDPLGSNPPNYGNGQDYGYKTYTLSMSETHAFDPTTINSLRAAWFDHAGIRSGQNTSYNPYSLFPQMIPSNNRGLPTIGISGYQGISDKGIGYYFPQYDLQLTDDLTHTFGKHTLQTGIDETGFKVYSRGGQFTPLPQWSFNGTWTGNQGWPGKPHSNGNAVADFLLGDAISASTGTPVSDKVQYSRDWEAYVQDVWQTTPNLTLNYGLRYVYQSPWSTRDNHVSYYDPATNKIALPENSETVTAPPGAVASMIQQYPFETTQAGNLPLGYFKPDWNNFGPRLGFAWRVFGNNQTVLRGGYGVYYNYNADYVGSSENASNIPWGATFTYSTLKPGKPVKPYLPDISFSQPFPSGSLHKPAANPIVHWMQQNYALPKVQEFNVTLEHQFGNNWMVRASYVGNRTDHLTFYSYDVNKPRLQQLGVPLQKQRPFQPWASILSTQSGNLSNDDQLQLQTQHRFASGFFIQGQYQWSHCLDEAPPVGGPQDIYNPFNDYGNCSFLRRQTAVFNYIYALPFGAGHRWLQSGILDQVFGDWQVSGITSYMTGTPFSITFAVPTKEVGWWGGRADIAPGVNPYVEDHSHNVGAQWFNPFAFLPPTPGTWGDSSRNMLYGPGHYNWDLGLMKNFIMPFEETQHLTVRADFLDAFNHTNWDNQIENVIGDTRDGGINIRDSGQIFSGEGNRVIQLSMRYVF